MGQEGRGALQRSDLFRVAQAGPRQFLHPKRTISGSRGDSPGDHPVLPTSGHGLHSNPAQGLHGAVLFAGGQFSRGLKMIKEGVRVFTNNGRLLSLYLLEFSFGGDLLPDGDTQPAHRVLARVKNLGFILKEAPFARRRAEHLSEQDHPGRPGDWRQWLYAKSCHAQPGTTTQQHYEVSKLPEPL